MDESAGPNAAIRHGPACSPLQKCRTRVDLIAGTGQSQRPLSALLPLTAEACAQKRRFLTLLAQSLLTSDSRSSRGVPATSNSRLGEQVLGPAVQRRISGVHVQRLSTASQRNTATSSGKPDRRLQIVCVCFLK